ncbi:uncharacterized protein LOC144903306 [Branchiostoma floridae x Branchiostoma belcheri]
MAHVQDRKKATESDAMLKLLCRLDGERKSVKEDKDEVQLKKMIDDATTLDDLMKNEDLFRVVEEILVEFGQYLEVKYPFKMANWLMRRRLRIGIRSFDEAGYKAILRMLIEELPSKQRWDTNAEDETVYGLERALHTKYKGLGFLNKTVDEVMDEEPFEDSPKLKDATKESQKEALRRCQMSCDLFEIRQHMQKSCFVGLIGPQNAGKSTLIEKTWGVKVTESWSFMTHTHLYRAKGTDRMVIIDFPGGTSIIDGCGGVSSILVLVMPFFMVMDHDVAQLAMEANKLAKDFYCSILLCISHCGRFTDILKDKGIVDAFREDYKNLLQIDPANILFTELVCPDNMESRGVVGPEGVRNWIKDWLIKFDVFTEDEDELYAAVNMTRV